MRRDRSRIAIAAVVAALLAPGPSRAVEGTAEAPSLAERLLKGCLDSPSEASMADLAASVGATPYSDGRNRQEIGKQTSHVTERSSHGGLPQRTLKTTTALRGWYIPGPIASIVEHREQTIDIEWLDPSAKHPERKRELTQSCRVGTQVASARAIFELYETLHADLYGVMIDPERRHFVVFRFDADSVDIELLLWLDAPMEGVPLTPEEKGMSRILLDDAGPRFMNRANAGVTVVNMSRAALLAGLDHPATIVLGNIAITPVVAKPEDDRSPSP